MSETINVLKDFTYLHFQREGNGGRKRKRETSMCSCLLYTLYWRPGWQPRHVPWLGIEPATLWFSGWHWTHRSIPARAMLLLFFKVLSIVLFPLDWQTCSYILTSALKIGKSNLFQFSAFPFWYSFVWTKTNAQSP